jgi:hypothetical protein
LECSPLHSTEQEKLLSNRFNPIEEHPASWLTYYRIDNRRPIFPQVDSNRPFYHRFLTPIGYPG